MMKSSYEFVSSAKDAGSQSTIVGGGRYSNLVKELGGPDLFAAGWGLGIDRLIDIMKIEQGEEYSQDIEDNIDIVIGTKQSRLQDSFIWHCERIKRQWLFN